MEKHKLIFFGTSDFAVPSLKALLNDGRFEVVGVVTQADKPAGRHAILTPPAIKKFLVSAVPARTGIPIKQPLKLKDEDFKSWITDIGPSCDAFVIVSYGKILPQWLLDLPKKGIVNVHGSLLPRWRGASPIQAAIAAGDGLSGVTVMLIDAEMDHGPLLATADEKILPQDTGSSLHDRLAVLGERILPDTLADYLEGKIQPQEQNHTKATYCKILSRDDGKLDFEKPAEELERLIRAFNPWPGTWMELDGKRIKILSARLGVSDENKTPGTRYIAKNIPCIACVDGTTLEISRLQLEGKNSVTGEDYLRGKNSW